jgi:hypothetical protein
MPFIGNKPSAIPLTSADIADSIITSAKIADGAIVNADINASAGIVSVNYLVLVRCYRLLLLLMTLKEAQHQLHS